MVNRLPKT